MTHALNAQECLERARMHEQLAATTADASARTMHQAMAAVRPAVIAQLPACGDQQRAGQAVEANAMRGRQRLNTGDAWNDAYLDRGA